MIGLQASVFTFLFALFSYQSTFADSVDTAFLSSSIQPIKNATLEHTESRSVRRYLLPLGAMIKINGKWRSKKHDILTGELTRTTYLLKDDESFDELRNLDGSISLNELYQYYLEQLNHHSASILFSCKGRNCGSSNQWGNGFVDNKRMVGRDRNQAYLSAQLVSKTSVSFVALYMVTNVTGETRVHIDHLSKPLNMSDQISFALDHKQSGRVLVVSVKDIDQFGRIEGIQEAFAKLAKNKTLYLIGHAYGNVSVEALKEKSLGYAKRLQQVLKDQGVHLPQMLLLEGLGPLAPTAESKDQLDRVELILH